MLVLSANIRSLMADLYNAIYAANGYSGPNLIQTITSLSYLITLPASPGLFANAEVGIVIVRLSVVVLHRINYFFWYIRKLEVCLIIISSTPNHKIAILPEGNSHALCLKPHSAFPQIFRHLYFSHITDSFGLDARYSLWKALYRLFKLLTLVHITLESIATSEHLYPFSDPLIILEP